jgi:hypothetical protein
MVIDNSLYEGQRKKWNVRSMPPYLVRKYKDIPYVALDIPKIVMDDNFYEIWEANKQPILRIKSDSRHPYSKEESAAKAAQDPSWQDQWTDANWDGLTLFRDQNGTADDRWTDPFVDGKTLFPKFFQQLYDYLPMLKLSLVVFWSNRIPVGFHRDLNEQLPIPTSLRIFIDDNNPRPTFMMERIPLDQLDTFQGKPPECGVNPIFVDLSNRDTNTFMYNNKDWSHGALKLSGHSKILGSIAIDIDWAKYDRLLERSIARYGNNLT